MMTRDVLLERELEDDDDEDGDIGELGVLRVGQLGALRPHPKARADAGGSRGPRVGAAPLAVEVGGNPRPLGGAGSGAPGGGSPRAALPGPQCGRRAPRVGCFPAQLAAGRQPPGKQRRGGARAGPRVTLEKPCEGRGP